MGRSEPRQAGAGFSLPELLVAVAVLGLLAALALDGGQRSLARMRVETATRRLGWGLEQARQQAQSLGQPCALELGPAGWREPSGGSLPGCGGVLADGDGAGEAAGVALQHNLPAALRFSSNGLVLDGGTVVVSAAGTELRRCLVMSLPLGVVRLGRYTGPLGDDPRSSACRAEETL
ncbi:GspH/FimT family protein [Cyanobium sp. FACHB-13342]|uniref:GspH/FimT family protein n=1 Tax=Cyanobium sp. FACHB-13342 TaxID=2692793 RepID=UPI0016813075|nr:GspH/FimT family protein [Cyanobium sp. FACHB-13342]MBD2422754.1 GspH/FimT family protein [Cyanobium sp. FACHB-13342]